MATELVVPEKPTADGLWPVVQIRGKSLRIVAIFPVREYAVYWRDYAAKKRAERDAAKPPRKPREKKMPVVDAAAQSPKAATSKIQPPVMVPAPAKPPKPSAKLVMVDGKTVSGQIGFAF